MSDAANSTAADLETALLNDATEGIASVSIDGHSVNAMSLDERLKVADRAKTTEATAQPHFGLRMTQLIPPGGGG